MSDLCQFGMIGMAVMGRNLALNVLDNGYSVAVYNRRPEPTEAAVAESGGKLRGTSSLEELVASLERPRKIMMMIKAGAPVDAVIAELRPLLEPGDIIIEGGNSWYEDTRRREKECREAGLKFFGVGVSGGEEGARFGPSLMPGGDKDAYHQALKPIFEAIAAKTDSGPCVTHVGPDGAGHFVKMVHNGIEYADMQFIAEAYHVLSQLGGLEPAALGEVFAEWNRGPLESFLIEITAQIFTVRDPKGGGHLIDQVLDKAGQKGTGRWTAQVAIEHGVPIPSISAAVDARVLSSLKAERQAASKILAGPPPARYPGSPDELVKKVHDALYAAKIVAYAQGMDLISTLSRTHEWGIDLREVARIWKGGCIIRARFLDTIMKAYEGDAEIDPSPKAHRSRGPLVGQLANLLLDAELREGVSSRQGAWREVVGLAQTAGIPVSAMASGLAYFDSYRTADLPQSLTQAQRDAFGAHTYQRKDDASGPFVHTDWLGEGS
jgi:6-phosphogluconate dehydrogenase